MLNPLDDYPVHQTPEPLAHPYTGDRNFYDRYFFNGYTRDGEVYFAVALGVYPNRFVQDAAFSLVRDGVQTSVHTSRRAPSDRTDTTVGPVAVEVVEPLRVLRVRMGPNESGVECDLTFTARTAPIEEPRFTHMRGTRKVMDYTRLTQFGAWTGTVDGQPVDALGSRDRSWGVRWVGEPEGGAPAGMPQFFWLWAPVNFDDVCTHFDTQEDADGKRWHSYGALVPLDGGDPQPADTAHRVTWRSGTRRAERAEIDIGEHTVTLEPFMDFQMLGLGYLHPEWGHGIWKGEEAVGVEQWKLADLDPLAPSHLHVQALCRARMGDREGIGILEQLAIGPHAPSGFTSLFDGAP